MRFKGSIWCVVLGLLLLSNSSARAVQYAYRVSFTDKNNTTYTFSDPLAYLSQRALDRRAVQGIAIDSTDLPVSDIYIQNVLTATSGILHVRSRWFNHIVILVDDPADVSSLSSLPYVSEVKQVGYYSTSLHFRQAEESANDKFKAEMAVPSFSSLAKTTGSAAFYGATWPQTTMVNGDYLHDNGYMGQGKLIAVLDEGFLDVPNNVDGFDSLLSSGRLLAKHDFVRDTDFVYHHGNHGTNSLSSMAGYWPGTYVGSAPLASYLLFITEDQTEQPIEMDNLLAASEKADSFGADVINISLGYNTFPGLPGNDFTHADLDGKTTLAAKAANMATSKGILFVASVGNEGLTGWGFLLTPGDADSALSIGGVKPDETYWQPSSPGPNSSGRIKPDVVVTAGPSQVLSGGNPVGINGTSYATPQVAGWAACLLQSKPGATPHMLRAAIDSSAHLHANPTPEMGYGIPNFHIAADILNVKVIPQLTNGWANVMPNPFSDKLSLWTTLTISDNISYSITDISGRVWLSASQKVDSGTTETKIVLPTDVPSGMYFIRVVSSAKEATLKLVKSN